MRFGKWKKIFRSPVLDNREHNWLEDMANTWLWLQQGIKRIVMLNIYYR